MELIKEEIVGGFTYSTDKQKLDLAYVHRFISERSYWGAGIPRTVMIRCIENSACFGVYDHDRQVGFARVITDYATFGYLADVFIDEAYRGKGLSKRLVDFIMSIEEFRIFRRMILVTRDAHGLYQRYGFKPVVNPGNYMELHRPDVYKTLQHDTLRP
jgi:N-acetylglutamate synthase-like GNAT family acetyltransferase